MSERLRTIRNAQALRDAGLINDDSVPAISDIVKRYALSITPTMQEMIETPDDPVALQFVPSAEEITITPEERGDPIGDEPFTPIKGITHRYPDRLLLKPLHICPVYCRFCFRREVVGPLDGMLSPAELDAAMDYIRSHSEVWEVILTGGDPLILSPSRLRPIIRALDRIEHVRVIRFHTRVPVVDPDRISGELIEALDVATPVWIVVHTNHAKEIGDGARAAFQRLSGAGIPLLSQTVLLKGVNDNPAALEQLFRTLVANKVKPYYLHQGDLAQGTSHFRTSIATGQDVMRQLRGRVSGVCQPLYVLDIPGGYGKVPIGPSYLAPAGANFTVTDPWGHEHAYPPV
jgi:lysine 2,3-aminomutase